jgi:inner membrane protein
MDPLSQAVVGGIAGQNVSNGQKIRIAGALAFISATLADLDYLIQSPSDPLLALEYHRQFTHSLFFIPVGGLVAAAVLHYLFARKYLNFKETFFYCTAGYATHALLDACTSYGTQLFWPFSNMRVSWNCISIIDPVFTLTLLLLIGIAHIWRKPVFSRAALVFGLSYLAFGMLQNHRAVEAGRELAMSRGHEPHRLQAKASLGNMIVWKIIYEHDGRYHVDAVRLTNNVKVIEGESIVKLNLQRDFPWLDLSSQQAKDIKRFAWFSDDFLSVSQRDKNVIMDMRYSILPNKTKGLWGIRLSPTAKHSEHVDYVNMREEANVDRRSSLNTLWEMMVDGASPE